jgi:hypothetical protein
MPDADMVVTGGRCMSSGRVNYLNRLVARVMEEHGVPVVSMDHVSARRSECSDGVHRHLCSVSRDALTEILSLPHLCGDDVLG